MLNFMGFLYGVVEDQSWFCFFFFLLLNKIVSLEWSDILVLGGGEAKLLGQ